MKFAALQREAKAKYGDKTVRGRLAKQAIELGGRWVDQNKTTGWFGDVKYKKHCKDACKQYIKDNINTEEAKEKYGSVILVIILGAVISWVIKRILDKLFPAE